MVSQDVVLNQLKQSVRVVDAHLDGDMYTVRIDRADVLKALQLLRDDPAMAFVLLSDLTAVHYPDRKGEEFCVVYHLHSLHLNIRLRLHVFLSEDDVVIPTATTLFAAANWMERETYDFFGIQFEGHPNLRRILNVDELSYFPLRKQYALEEQTRQDKDDAMFGRTTVRSQQ